MSFLDNLENSLKSLESQEDAAQNARENRERQESELATAQAAAPYAERLKEGAFTAALLNEASVIGHGLRTKVHITWLGTTLRLDAKEKRLELKPSGDGVMASFLQNGASLRETPIDLDGDGAELARQWLQG